MKEEKLKTANEIELIDSSSAESADKIQSTRDANFDSQTFDNTLESNQAGDETLLAQESPEEIASFIKANRTAPEEDNLVGKIFGGHYEILEFIGQGGMSRVYKAKHLRLNATSP